VQMAERQERAARARGGGRQQHRVQACRDAWSTERTGAGPALPGREEHLRLWPVPSAPGRQALSIRWELRSDSGPEPPGS